MKIKSLVFCLMSFVLVAANAQGLQRTLGNRLARPTTSQTSQTPQTSQTSESASADSGGRSIEFNAAPVDMVFTVYQDLIGKTVLKDPQTPAATITLQPKKGQVLSDEDKIEAIETVLEMNGIHIEPYGEKFVRALPRKDVRKDGIPLIMDPEAPLGESTRVVSLMIPFKNIAIDEAQKALEGFKSNNGILLVFERTNSILVTDTEQIINRMREIAKAIDIASPVQETVEYIQIKYANANEVKQVIDNIVQESMKEQEKNGNKVPQNNAAPSAARPLLGGLRRPGQQNQPAAPVNNESLVMTVSDADRGMIRGKVVTIADERSNKILLITNAANMKFFKQVIEALDVETTPDTVVKVYRLKYAEAEDVSDMINDLIGNSSSSKDSKGNQNQNAKQGQSGSVTRGTQSAAKKPANQRTGEAKAGELNKENTTVLADKRINGLVVMTQKELVPTIEQIIESMDIKLSQVLIETVIIEVSLGNGIETGMDWVQKGRQSTKVAHSVKNGFLEDKYYAYNKNGQLSDLAFTEGEWAALDATRKEELGLSGISDVFEQVAGIARNGIMNNWNGATRTALAGGGANGMNAFNVANGNFEKNPSFTKPFNFVFDSDELGLAAILEASKTDSHSKYVASPIVMTLDNKEAVVNTTKMSYILKGFTSSGNSYSTIATPDYEQKELGIELKITPKINPNGTVMLTVEEKYTQLGEEQPIQYVASNSAQSKSVVEQGTQLLTGSDETNVGSLQTVLVPTTITREMSADVLLEDHQTVVFGGLTETKTENSESGIPILKDIPIVGRWLFGHVKETETRTELLVFMTPYVLDDAQAAQIEALRRKKTMSDQRAWDDHGWSLSPLADPVSKQEQMRRIKDLWRIQDEERRTKIAIEKAKVERVKQLEKMSKDEREMWLKMHKKELDDEAQDELEEKMLDEKSQEELKKLAAQIKAKKLGEAEKAIKAAEDEAAAENERGKLDAAKKAAAPAPVAAPAPAKTENRENVLNLIDQLSEESKAK